MSTPGVRSAPPARLLRRPAVWLALLGAGYLVVNVVRAVVAPAAFAEYVGVPLADAADGGWVVVYASRTLVLAVVALVLLARRRLRELAVVFAVAVVAPVTDAALALGAGAAAGTVARHAGIALYLVVTGAGLAHAARRGGS